VNAALTLRRNRVSRKEDTLEEESPAPAGDGHAPRHEQAQVWCVEADALTLVEREEMRELMLKALDQLPDTLRVAFVLKDLEDWTTEAIAEYQGVSPVLLRQRLHRARMFMVDAVRAHLSGSRPCR
jgi:RNA polymerase sigma factor (sigma-70 family)